MHDAMGADWAIGRKNVMEFGSGQQKDSVCRGVQCAVYSPVN